MIDQIAHIRNELATRHTYNLVGSGAELDADRKTTNLCIAWCGHDASSTWFFKSIDHAAAGSGITACQACVEAVMQALHPTAGQALPPGPGLPRIQLPAAPGRYELTRDCCFDGPSLDRFIADGGSIGTRGYRFFIDGTISNAALKALTAATPRTATRGGHGTGAK